MFEYRLILTEDGLLPPVTTQHPEKSGNVWLGIATAIAIPLAPLIASILIKVEILNALASATFYSFGIAQWLWIAPLMRSARREGHFKFARGLKIGALILFVPYALLGGILGGSWALVHLDLTPGHPWFYMHAP